MAVNQIKDDLNVSLAKDREVVIIDRKILDEYDFENVLNMYKAQVKRKYSAQNIIENFDGFIQEEEAKIRENAKSEFLRLSQIKKGVDEYFEMVGDSFYEIIPDPTTGEKELILDRERFSNIIKNNWDALMKHMVMDFYEQKLKAESMKEFTKEHFDEQIDSQIASLIEKFGTYVGAHKQELSEAQRNIDLYEPIVEKIIKRWGITMDDLLADLIPAPEMDDDEELETIEEEKEQEIIEEEE